MRMPIVVDVDSRAYDLAADALERQLRVDFDEMRRHAAAHREAGTISVQYPAGKVLDV